MSEAKRDGAKLQCMKSKKVVTNEGMFRASELGVGLNKGHASHPTHSPTPPNPVSDSSHGTACYC